MAKTPSAHETVNFQRYAYPVHAGAPCIFDEIQWPTTDYRCQRDKHIQRLMTELLHPVFRPLALSNAA
jgi:hypothetical protein